MTPAGYVVLSEIPITAHGKIDRTALPQPDIAAGAEYRDPTTATEHRIAALFSALLGRDRVGVDDSFFDLGGHSLVATKLVTAIRAECGVELGIRDVFELGTVGRLAERIDQLGSGAVDVSRPKLIGTAHDEPQPLSASQLRSWFAYRIDGPSWVNNIPFAAKLTGPWDIESLIAAIGDVVARHEILRTGYVEIDGVPYQVVNQATDLPIRRATFEGGDSAVWLQEQLDTERQHCFELDCERPIRVALLRTGADEHVMSFVVHHIASDHWSAGVLFSDVLTAYRARRCGEVPSWAPLRVQYADYAAWQRAFLGDSVGRIRRRQRAARILDPAAGRHARGHRTTARLSASAGAQRAGNPSTSASTRPPAASSLRCAARWASLSSCCCKRPSPSCCTRPAAAWTSRWAPR